MDGSRFDRLARSLAGAHSRRCVLGGLLGVAVRLARIPSAGAACPPGQVLGTRGRCLCQLTGRPPVDGVCPCPNGQTDLGDGQGCRECRSSDDCPPADACTSYTCVAGRCDHAKTVCLDSDPCGKVSCDRTLGCVTTPLPDNAPGDCADGAVCCAGRGCTELGTTSDCRACGESCSIDAPFCDESLGCVDCLSTCDCAQCQTCVGGACVVDEELQGQSCDPQDPEFGALCCGGACVDLPDDQDHLCCGTALCT